MYHHNPAKPATPAQRRLLAELGVAVPERLSSYRANLLIRENAALWSQMPPTAKQEAYLRHRGLWRSGMTRGEATEQISRLEGRTDWPTIVAHQGQTGSQSETAPHCRQAEPGEPETETDPPQQNEGTGP